MSTKLPSTCSKRSTSARRWCASERDRVSVSFSYSELRNSPILPLRCLRRCWLVLGSPFRPERPGLLAARRHWLAARRHWQAARRAALAQWGFLPARRPSRVQGGGGGRALLRRRATAPTIFPPQTGSLPPPPRNTDFDSSSRDRSITQELRQPAKNRVSWFSAQ